MEVTLNSEKRRVYSAFKRNTRPFTEVDAVGVDYTIPKGTSLPDLVRKYYGTQQVTLVTGYFAFLDRDNKERAYKPTEEDQFVFSSLASVHKFKEEALKLITVLNAQWTSLGLPLVLDKDRQVLVPDSDVIWQALGDNNHQFHTIVMKHRYDIQFLVANADIAKKFCVVRNVIPGWWASSYKGKNSQGVDHFKPALAIWDKVVKVVTTSALFKAKLTAVIKDAGDPLDTNAGYPFFTSEVDSIGRPITKLRQLELFKGIGKVRGKFEDLQKFVADRMRGEELAKFPFLLAPIRRTSPGYKYAHDFERKTEGLVTKMDVRGGASTRIAWMASYVLNLLLSPSQSYIKAVRMCIPGLFHDGDDKRREVKWIKDPRVWTAEADYSNYDRFLPLDISAEAMKLTLQRLSQAPTYVDWLKALHTKLPMVWPDYIGDSEHNGWAFYPGMIGLASGLKITSEEGSVVNAIVCIQSVLDSGLATEAQIVDNLTSYVTGKDRRPWFMVASDDTLLLADSANDLFRLGNSFLSTMKKAGLKGSLEFGDRFLMRHVRHGYDRPVPMRVWQNSLSNEEPPSSEIQMLAGLASRTDGLGGQKTVDPFGTGLVSTMSPIERNVTLSVLSSLKLFFRSAHRQSPTAIQFLDELDAGCTNARQVSGGYEITPYYAERISKIRRIIVKTLAEAELATLSGNAVITKKFQTWLYKLHKDQNIPSQKALLDQILLMNPVLQSSLNQIAAKEHNFYVFAMNRLGVKPMPY